MAKKRLTLRDKQGNVIDYDISAARVTIDVEGKSLDVKLSELAEAIASATMRVMFNGQTFAVNNSTINIGNQMQPDWAETSTTYPAYIKNKPNVVTGIKVGASGSTITPTNGVVTIPESGGGSVEVDDAMSATSEHSVQNKVIKAYVDNLINGLINGAPAALDTLNELSAALGNDSNFAATITNALANKVDNVPGKGLSTNDYTNADKAAVATIPNKANAADVYDKSTVDSMVADAGKVKTVSVNGGTPAQPDGNGNVNLVVQAGAQGPKGDKGDTVVLDPQGLPEFAIVNDLTTGGESDALSAEMGRRLAMLSGTFAEAWAHAQAIPYIFPWLWVETVNGDAICKPIWHRGSGNFVDAAGGNNFVQASAAPNAPTFSETSGSTVGKGTQLTITPAAGSALYYKIDNGSWIVRDMAVTIEVNATCTITAKCVNNYGPSSEVTCSLTVSGPAVPTFAAAQGTTIGTGNVVSRGGSIVVSVPQGGELHYSTDGTNYTTASGLSVTIPVPAAGVHIYAYNVEDGDQSGTIDNAYTMAALAAPSFSPAAGTLPQGGGTVAITHTDNNVDIFYTTDGSTPTASSTQYTQPISVTADMTIKAIAKDNYGTSEVASAAYTVPVDHKFQFKIALTGDNSTEYVPIRGSGSPAYNFIVDWDDGTTTAYQNAGGADKEGATKGCSHQYTGVTGTKFTITLRGSKIPYLEFNSSSLCNIGALVAILDNTLECDTNFTTPSYLSCFGPNLSSICANALQNNINPTPKLCDTKLTSVPSGLLNHLTKQGVNVTSCYNMFKNCKIQFSAQNVADLKQTISTSSMTSFGSMFYGIGYNGNGGTIAIPDDFFDGVTDGAITTISQMTYQATGMTGDAQALYDVLKNKVASGTSTSQALASTSGLTFSEGNTVPSGWK